jgi:hypothetical protein
VLTLALLVHARWSVRATFLASVLFLILALLNLFTLVVVLAGTASAGGPAWYFPFRCVLAVVELMLFVALAVLLAEE